MHHVPSVGICLNAGRTIRRLRQIWKQQRRMVQIFQDKIKRLVKVEGNAHCSSLWINRHEVKNGSWVYRPANAFAQRGIKSARLTAASLLFACRPGRQYGRPDSVRSPPLRSHTVAPSGWAGIPAWRSTSCLQKRRISNAHRPNGPLCIILQKTKSGNTRFVAVCIFLHFLASRFRGEQINNLLK